MTVTDKAIRLYKRGLTRKYIAETLGISVKHVNNILYRNNIEIRDSKKPKAKIKKTKYFNIKEYSDSIMYNYNR